MQAVDTTIWSRILVVYVVGVLAAMQLGTLPPILLSLQRELAAPPALVAAAVSAPTLVGAVAGMAVGAWSARVGHMRVLRAGLVIMAAMAGASAAAADGVVLLGLRACLGVGYLMVVAAAPSLMAQLARPPHQPIALSLWGTFVPVGLALAGGLAGLLVDDVGWRGFLWVDAGLLAGAVVAAGIALRDAADRPAAVPATRVWPDRRTPMLLACAFFCFAWTFLAVAAVLPGYLTLDRGMSGAEASGLVAVATTGGAGGSLLAGPLLRRGVSLRVVAAFGLLVPAAAGGLVFVRDVPMAAVVAAIVVFFTAGGLVPAAAFAAVPRLVRVPGEIGPVNGLLAQFGSIGSLTGPPLLVLWVDWTGWAWAPVPVGLVSLAGWLCAQALPATDGVSRRT